MIRPNDAQDLWREKKTDKVAATTLQRQSYHVDQFVAFLNENGIDDIGDVTAMTVHQYRVSFDPDIKQNTLSNRIATVRRFLSFCGSIHLIDPAVPERIELPARGADSRDVMLELNDAERLLQYYRKFDYGSRRHAILELTWHTAMRTGTLRGLDLDDLEADELRVRVRHRPPETPLKNGSNAERYVALGEQVTDVLTGYVTHYRLSVEDDAGRRPLFTTAQGRPSINTFQREFYSATRPCEYTGECPHDKDPLTCDAANRTKSARNCPSTVSGHPVRRGSLTNHLRNDIPENVVSDRADVSRRVLDEHYDRRREEEKTEQRRGHLDGI